jgi:hypothetical protein
VDGGHEREEPLQPLEAVGALRQDVREHGIVRERVPQRPRELWDVSGPRETGRRHRQPANEAWATTGAAGAAGVVAGRLTFSPSTVGGTPEVVVSSVVVVTSVEVVVDSSVVEGDVVVGAVVVVVGFIVVVFSTVVVVFTVVEGQ